jgi:hypothetical protein
VYRAAGPGVPLDTTHFVGTSADTVFVDAAAPAGPLHYVVTAIDVHSNESAASNEAAATGPGSGAPEIASSLSTLTLRPCAPNPFAGSTTVRFGLPRGEDVAIEIIDVTGRRVRAARLGRLPAGWNSWGVDASDADGRRLANGVYFVRVSAGGAQRTTRVTVRN